MSVLRLRENVIQKDIYRYMSYNKLKKRTIDGQRLRLGIRNREKILDW